MKQSKLLELQDKKQSNKNSSEEERQEVMIEYVDETPFYIIGEEEEFVICSGNMRMSRKTFETEKEAREYVEEKPWELIGNLAFLNYLKANEIKEERE